MTQRIELRKRAATSEPPVVCWNRVGGQPGGYYWPDGCKGSPDTTRMCTMATVPLDATETYNYLQWVNAGKPYIPGCMGTPTPTPPTNTQRINWTEQASYVRAGDMTISIDGQAFRYLPDPGKQMSSGPFGGLNMTGLTRGWSENNREISIWFTFRALISDTPMKWILSDVSINYIPAGSSTMREIRFTDDVMRQLIEGQYGYAWGTNSLRLTSNAGAAYPATIQFNNLELAAFTNALSGTRTPTPTWTPSPTCIPLPSCVYTPSYSNGLPVYCSPPPPPAGGSYCPRPTFTPTPTPLSAGSCQYARNGAPCSIDSCVTTTCTADGTCLSRRIVGGTCSVIPGTCQNGQCVKGTPTPTQVTSCTNNGGTCQMSICKGTDVKLCSIVTGLCTNNVCNPPPTGCTYQMVRCIQAPCNPILVCPTPSALNCTREPEFSLTPATTSSGVVGGSIFWNYVLKNTNDAGCPATSYSFYMEQFPQVANIGHLESPDYFTLTSGSVQYGSIKVSSQVPQQQNAYEIGKVYQYLVRPVRAERTGPGSISYLQHFAPFTRSFVFNNGTVTPSPTCMPRPACMDPLPGQPACMYKLPAGGWFCPQTPTPSTYCKTGVNSFAVGDNCSGTDTYKSATYACYDGFSSKIVMASCQTSVSLANLAQQACAGHSACTTPSIATGKIGDLNNDNKVNLYDFNILLNNFGKTGKPGFVPADLNKDGSVNLLDFNLLLKYFE